MTRLAIGCLLASCVLIAGCAQRVAPTTDDGVEPPDNEAELAVVPASTSAPSVVVSDDPPRELRFTSQLSSSQRAVIRSELAEMTGLNAALSGATAVDIDLNADGTNEVLVMIKNNAWCGSGDVCNIWLFGQTADGWRQLGSGRDAGSCVSVLPTATNGYRDLRLHGQCAVEMCTFDLRYDGNQYQWDGNSDCEEIPELILRQP